ncbi:hypothetical protein P375_04030 [Gallibacterium genomosp. 2]|uniref:Lipoprotein n=1 Tax=Gallibacterium genomosp. 2 TaxID=155517 RepID=A0A0A2Y671_9PAST|nr:hypothetical protein [Gallibacterium genomosp. 2]KGQ32969.1 hypothetical protein P375_04030 [Gallibacterium genomosp. 2]
MMKSKNLSLLLSVAFAFVLSACSQLALPGKEKPAPVAEKVAENAELKAISDSAKSLPSFIYQTANQTYTAYFSGKNIVYIDVSGNKVEKIYLKNGQVIAVANNTKLYDFNVANADVDALQVKRNAESWVKKLSYNSADKNIGAVRTGEEAKLNYLCIAKVQQVAGTKRVLRTSGNSAGSTSRLTAKMRLNGNQFYQMDCILSGDRVAKLSLIANK